MGEVLDVSEPGLAQSIARWRTVGLRASQDAAMFGDLTERLTVSRWRDARSVPSPAVRSTRPLAASMARARWVAIESARTGPRAGLFGRPTLRKAEMSCEQIQAMLEAKGLVFTRWPCPEPIVPPCSELAPDWLRLQPPDMACAGTHTSACFGGRWPAGCDDLAPCRSSARCVVPSADAVEAARVVHGDPMIGHEESAVLEWSDVDASLLKYGRFVEDPDLTVDVEARLAASGATLDDLNDLVATAWALLASTLDVVEWVCCYVQQSPDLLPVDCAVVLRPGWDLFGFVRDAVTGVIPVRVGLVADDPDGRFANGADGGADPVACVVTLPVLADNCPWGDDAAKFASGTDDMIQCKALTLASVMLHELTHMALRQFCFEQGKGAHADDPAANYTFGDPLVFDASGACINLEACPCWDEAQMATGAYQWAIGQLCPDIVALGACCRYGDGWLFLRSGDQSLATCLAGGASGVAGC